MSVPPKTVTSPREIAEALGMTPLERAKYLAAKPYAELTDDERAANVLKAFEPLRDLADRFTSADKRFLLLPVMDDGKTPLRLAMARIVADDIDAATECDGDGPCKYVAMPLAWAVLAARAYMESDPAMFGDWFGDTLGGVDTSIGLNGDADTIRTESGKVGPSKVCNAAPTDLGDGLGLEVPERFCEATGPCGLETDRDRHNDDDAQRAAQERADREVGNE